MDPRFCVCASVCMLYMYGGERVCGGRWRRASRAQRNGLGESNISLSNASGEREIKFGECGEFILHARAERLYWILD